jgi:predicted permease
MQPTFNVSAMACHDRNLQLRIVPGARPRYNKPVNEFLTVLAAVLPVFGIMGIGWWLRVRHWLTADADQSLMRLVINLLIPCLIIQSVLGNPALRRPENLLLPPLIGFGMVALGIAVARAFARLAGLRTKPERRTFAFLTGLQNYAYLTIPLCVSLFDANTTGVLFVHNVGAEMALWTLGMAVLTGSSLASGWKNVLNAPLIALLVALALNFLGPFFTLTPVANLVTKTVLTAVLWLGQSAIPLALLLIGAIVADQLEGAAGGQAVRVASVAVLVRLALMPVLFVLLAKFLPCSVEFKRVLLLQGAMPSAVLPIVLAKHCGGDSRTGLQVVLGTSLAGFITIPLWIHFGGHVIGLW